ncbi:MAG: shikimate dehydrogenase [Acetobacteraceae bacterium]
MQGEPSVLLGLIGYGIQGSLTPAMHEQEAAEQGLRCVYRMIDLERLGLGAAALGELITAAERMGFAGLNITFPCKQAALPLLDALSPDARAVGAVNTVLLRDGRRIGHNTDVSGFAESFRRGFPDVPRQRVVQIGAGGAGAAVAHALLALGAGEVTVFDLDPTRATNLAAALVGRFGNSRAIAGGDPGRAIERADGLVNATPVGMRSFPGLPVPAETLRPELWVADVIYVPIETALLARARALGCRTLDGGGMAVFQAVSAFELFTGRRADAGRMRRHFEMLRGDAAANREERAQARSTSSIL